MARNKNIFIAVCCSTSGLLAMGAQPTSGQQSDTGQLQEIVITAEDVSSLAD
jgi:hypothetical protein